MTKIKTATIFGGTGFVGRQIVRELGKAGITVKVATRVPERAYFLKPCGTVGQIVPVACNYNDPDSIARAVAGSDAVINCIGILFEKGRSTFARAHVDIPLSIAKACATHKVSRFVHISALGVDAATSKYAATKRDGEAAILSVFPKATILRPSVVFGEDDGFFNLFATLSVYLPVLPLIGGGKTKFQPVFVGDVADAAIAAIMGKVVDAAGKTYELGGPDVVSFKDIYNILFHYTGRKRVLMPLPFGAAKMQAFFMNLLPRPLLTPDQVESLKTDTVVAPGASGLQDLGITPTGMDLILPTYLARFRPGGRFADHKAA